MPRSMLRGACRGAKAAELVPDAICSSLGVGVKIEQLTQFDVDFQLLFVFVFILKKLQAPRNIQLKPFSSLHPSSWFILLNFPACFACEKLGFSSCFSCTPPGPAYTLMTSVAWLACLARFSGVFHKLATQSFPWECEVGVASSSSSSSSSRLDRSVELTSVFKVKN